MDVRLLVTAAASVLLVYRLCLAVYRLCFHPLAGFPGPRLAAVSTLYRAYHQTWRDGKMLHKTMQLHEEYGPVVRFSPNELTFRNPAAYHEIYSHAFNGIKDPDFYQHLGGQAETFFTMGDPARHRARFRPVASLFAKRHFDRCEPGIRRAVERFCAPLSSHARRAQPCNLAMGYRSLLLKIVNDFIFTNVPETLRSLASDKFDDPLCAATAGGVNWTLWFSRNFPRLNALICRLPRRLLALITSEFEAAFEVTDIIEALVKHEKDQATATTSDSVMRRLINAHRDGKSESPAPYSDVVLASEAEVTMWGGILDLCNILPLGTFMVSQDSRLQQRLFQELQSVWLDRHDPIPRYDVLRHLPLLNGVVKESMRLTHGIATGPARVVGPGGACVDGHRIPAKAVVAAPSYFVHMNPAVFPRPERFDPERWIDDDDPGPVVVFSKGRRMCPAAHFANVEAFAALAAVFRRFRVAAHETTIEDFEWDQYFSIQFNGRPLQVTLEERSD